MPFGDSCSTWHSSAEPVTAAWLTASCMLRTGCANQGPCSLSHVSLPFFHPPHGHWWDDLSGWFHNSTESHFYLNLLSFNRIGCFCSSEVPSEPVTLARYKVWPRVTGDRAGRGSWTNSGPWPLGMAACWAVQVEGPRGEKANNFEWFSVALGKTNTVFTIPRYPHVACVLRRGLRTVARFFKNRPFYIVFPFHIQTTQLKEKLCTLLNEHLGII